MSKYLTKKNIFLAIALFFIFLIWNLILVPVNLDEIWNYGFSHNIYSGLVPYRDFNMIITPFYNFLMSLGFHLFGSSMLVFHVEQAILLVILCFMLFYLLKDKGWLVIVFFFFPLPASFPNYNFFLFFLLVLLFILEKNKNNDYLIGFVVGLLILTKQSVGFCILLVSLLYYVRDFKKVIRRCLGTIIPIFIFCIYLLITNSFLAFLDLCLFGLFDFASENGNGFNFYFLLFLFFVGLTIYFIIKDKRKIYNYYALAFYSILIPLMDSYHFQFVFMVFLVLFLMRVKRLPIKPVLLCFGIIIGVFVVSFSYRFDEKVVYPNYVNHFEYRLLENSNLEITKGVNELISKYKGSEIIFLNSNAYYFKLINDMPISYFDLINMGNWGYDGSNKLLKGIKRHKDALFVVDKSELLLGGQIDKKAILYVIDNGQKIDEVFMYDIYTLNIK